VTEIVPFRGVRYGRDASATLAEVLCPPYDIISEEQQKQYYARSPYNAIRLEYPVDVEGGTDSESKYARAARDFRSWLEKGILVPDAEASFYVHDQHFVYRGHSFRRRGLVARVRLRAWYDGVYPHEETFAKAKQDRLELMRACRANFSPLLALYQDPDREVAAILSQTAQADPLLEAQAATEAHEVWALREPDQVQRVGALLSGQPLYIADGHHRYETALAYREERCGEGGPCGRSSVDSGVDYTMMTLVAFSDPGLVIYPVHRLVRGVDSSELERLDAVIGESFSVEYVATGEVLAAGQGEMLRDAAIGVVGLMPGQIALLRLREDVMLDEVMPGDRSRSYRTFEVSLLNHLILARISSPADGPVVIDYTPDAGEVCTRVADGSHQLGFLLRSPQPETVKAFADAKDRMPRKSTYFHPKPPAGLMINSLDPV
jgi:uncharacterized protein (DUF1015 family)